ncbi:hypothetical protein ACJW31_10G147600 [Castanea mollissima]
MASLVSTHLLLQLVLLISLFHFNLAARRLADSAEAQQPLLFQYHNGPLLTGKISINLICFLSFVISKALSCGWGQQAKSLKNKLKKKLDKAKIKVKKERRGRLPSQRTIISDFVTSLSTSTPTTAQPSVATWWKTTDKYYQLSNSKNPSTLVLSMGTQIIDETYSLGKSLSNQQIEQLASKDDVAVEGFCMSKCGTHGSLTGATVQEKFTYIWVGNSETQCPGQCAWPFHQPIYGPQSPPLVAPNNDVGLDGMVINLASLLAGTTTNPFGNGFFQGPKDAPLEATSACPGVYGKGAYPGYAGDLLVDPATGASYNANAANGRKYLVPALFDPSTQTCSTIV